MPIFRRIANLFSRSKVDREIDAELRSHIEMRIADNMAAGMSPEAAARDARLRFGNPAVAKERTAEKDAALGLDALWADLRYALRQMRRSPGFALVVVVTLALAIGANLAVFQLLYGVMLAQLPIRQPAQLYSLHALKSPFDGQWFFSYPAYRRLRQASGSALPVIARSGLGQGTLQGGDGSAGRVSFQLVSGNFFSVLGISPFAGRLFVDSDDRSAQNEWPVVLRYEYAREHFALDRLALDGSLLGRRFVLNGVPVVIVGVASERFAGVMRGFAPDLWLPLEAQASGQLGAWFDSLGPGYGIHLDAPWQNQPGIFWLWLLARVPDADRLSAAAQWTAALQPDISLIAATSKDARIRGQLLKTNVQLVSASSGEGLFFQSYSSPLLLLMAMASVIFLVGCLNLANLQLARLWGRHREIAIRISLGAGRWRVMRQILVEDLLLASVGGLLALATGRAASALLLRWASGRDWPIAFDLHLNPYVVLLGAALLIGSLVLFSLLPAWWITRSSFTAAAGSKRVDAAAMQSPAMRRWSSSLLAGQVCFSLLLVGMAYMFGQTLLSTAHIDAGLDREHVISVHLDMTGTGFAKGQNDLPVLYREMIERLKALPGVTDAAVQMCSIPGCGWNTAIHVFGQPGMAEAQVHGEENHIGTGYFQTLGIPILRGRDFSAADRPNTQPVAILNRAYAKKLFGSENPVGHWIGYRPAPEDHKYLIVGEVADARLDGLREPAPPVVYLSADQNSDVIHTIELRAAGPLGPVAKQIRQALHTLAPELPVTEIVALNTEFEDELATETLLARLTAVFGALTLALAALGFYGLLSFRVTRRTAEIGIRMALGATRAQIQILVLRQTFVILLTGILPGVVLTEAMSRAARSVLYGSGRADSVALLFATAALIAVGVIATLLPAHRAASTDAIQALRNE
jgi:predicted permease